MTPEEHAAVYRYDFSHEQAQELLSRREYQRNAFSVPVIIQEISRLCNHEIDSLNRSTTLDDMYKQGKSDAYYIVLSELDRLQKEFEIWKETTDKISK